MRKSHRKALKKFERIIYGDEKIDKVMNEEKKPNTEKLEQ